MRQREIIAVEMGHGRPSEQFHRIPASNAVNARLDLYTGGAVALIGLALWWWLGKELPGFPFLLVGPLFFLAGSVFFFGRWMVRSRREGLHGPSNLAVSDFHLGGRLRGTVQTARDVKATGPFQVSLSCIETVAAARYSSAGGDRGCTSDRQRFKVTQRVPAEGLRTSEGIPVDFAIPAAAPATSGSSELRAWAGVRWILEVAAAAEGMRYYAIFLLMVRERR